MNMQTVVLALLLAPAAAFVPSGLRSSPKVAPTKAVDGETGFWQKDLELLPGARDSGLAGDVGFDPAGFAKTQEELLNFRDAEIKHARIAMLAAAGWPLSELWDKGIAQAEGLPTLLQDPMAEGLLPYGSVKFGLAPSLLNGGLGEVPPLFWLVTLAATAAIELRGKAAKEEGKLPGDLGFDPLGFAKGATAEEYRRLEEQELSHGRTAMLAITTFVAEEAVFKGPVVENTPAFFQPAASFVTPEGAEALNFAGFEAAASAVNEGIMYPVLELLNKLGFSEMQNIL